MIRKMDWQGAVCFPRMQRGLQSEGAKSSSPTTKNPGSPMYASQIRALSGGSRWVQAQPAGSEWNRALPGPYPSKRGPEGAF